MKRVLAVLLLMLIVLPVVALSAEVPDVEVVAEGGSSLISTWLPVGVGLLLSLGVLDYLIKKIKESSLVQKLHAEHLVDMLADRLVAWAENYSKSTSTGILSGTSKHDLVKSALKTKLLREGVALPEAELESAIEAAHSRANFPHAATSTSG